MVISLHGLYGWYGYIVIWFSINNYRAHPILTKESKYELWKNGKKENQTALS